MNTKKKAGIRSLLPLFCIISLLLAGCRPTAELETAPEPLPYEPEDVYKRQERHCCSGLPYAGSCTFSITSSIFLPGIIKTHPRGSPRLWVLLHAPPFRFKRQIL